MKASRRRRRPLLLSSLPLLLQQEQEQERDHRRRQQRRRRMVRHPHCRGVRTKTMGSGRRRRRQSSPSGSCPTALPLPPLPHRRRPRSPNSHPTLGSSTFLFLRCARFAPFCLSLESGKPARWKRRKRARKNKTISEQTERDNRRPPRNARTRALAQLAPPTAVPDPLSAGPAASHVPVVILRIVAASSSNRILSV
jgi:hypothetical protein